MNIHRLALPVQFGKPDVSTANVLDQFRTALVARDIVPPEPIIADGLLHRCNTIDRNGRGDAAYLLHLDGLPVGGFTNWRDGQGWQAWRLDLGRSLSVPEREALRARWLAAREKGKAETARRYDEARQRAARIWSAARAAPADHPYLGTKGVMAHGLRTYRGALVVPVHDVAGVLHSLQFIGVTGDKRFLKGGRVQGMCCWIGVANTETICIAEGFATGASVHEATAHKVAVAFHAGNLEAVARSVRENFPQARIVVCADDDCNTQSNPGLTCACQAAGVVGGCVAIPDFGADRPQQATDFNDLHRHTGLSAVLAAVKSAMDAADLSAAPSEADLRGAVASNNSD
jgi:putative DNA primase/helicase